VFFPVLCPCLSTTSFLINKLVGVNLASPPIHFLVFCDFFSGHQSIMDPRCIVCAFFPVHLVGTSLGVHGSPLAPSAQPHSVSNQSTPFFSVLSANNMFSHAWPFRWCFLYPHCSFFLSNSCYDHPQLTPLTAVDTTLACVHRSSVSLIPAPLQSHFFRFVIRPPGLSVMFV